MIKRLVGKELIEQSLLELLKHKTIEEITVTEISKNCGITTRTFYYYFADKHDVVSSIYNSFMEPFINCPMNEWYEHLTEFFLIYESFAENCLIYNGQNCLSDTIVNMDRRKLDKHIKPEIRLDAHELKRTHIALEYMFFGNVGSIRNYYVHKKHSAMINLMDVYDCTWSYLCDIIPSAILQNLSMEPVDL